MLWWKYLQSKKCSKKCIFCGGTNHSADTKIKRIRQEKEKARADGHSDNRRMERTPHKCFRCGSGDYETTKCPKNPKENEKWRKQVLFNENFNHACNNGENNSDQKIYASMACMSGSDKCTSGNFGDSSKLTNWNLVSGATCHMMSEVSDFILCYLEDTDKHIKVADRHHVTERKKVKCGIKKVCDNNGDAFIATLDKILLALDL